MLTDRVLKVGVEYAFYTSACDLVSNGLQSSTRCPYPGRRPQFIGRLLTLANISYSLHTIPNDFQLIQALVLNGTVDLIATTSFFITQKRMDLGFQFSVPIPQARTYSAILQSTRSDYTSLVRAYSKAYTPHTWFLIALTYLCYKVSLSATRRITKRRKDVFHMLIDVLAAFGLGSYGNSLLASILMPQPFYVFTDYNGMLNAVNNGNIQLIADTNRGWFWSITESNLSKFDRFQSVFQSHPPTSDNNASSIRSRIASGEYFFVSSTSYVHSLTAQHCHAQVIELPEFGDVTVGFLFSPTTPQAFLRRINEQIMQSENQVQYLDEHYRRRQRRLNRLDCAQSTQPTIGLTSSLLVILALALGQGIAILLLFAELLSVKILNRISFRRTLVLDNEYK